MKIGFVTIAYNGAQYTQRLLDSAISERHELDRHLFLHSERFADVVEVCDTFATQNPDVHYYRYGVNRGLCKSWNDGILNAFERGCDTVIVANHDIKFGRGDVDGLAECALKNAHAYAVTMGGWHHRFQRIEDTFAFSVFAINKVAIDVLGCFDENFFPIYFEDSDYHRRAHLAGLTLAHYQSVASEHGGSESIHSDTLLMQQHNVTFPLCHQYYLAKWGGEPPTDERFIYPWGNAEIPLRIDPADRHAPYARWGLDRVDQDVVKI